jgi:hypothetical protein
MSEQNAQPRDGGPAFPMPLATHEGSAARLDECTPTAKRHLLGMTLRDYFAAKAMAAMIEDQRSPEYLQSFEGSVSAHDTWVASRAYEMADVMLKARAG